MEIAIHIILGVYAIFIGYIFANAIPFMGFKLKSIFFAVNGYVINPRCGDVTQMPDAVQE